MKLNFEMLLDWLAKHRIAVVSGFIGLIVLLLILLVTLHVNNRGNKKNLEVGRALSEAYTAEPLKRQELFIEEEPDFVPKFLYFREPQTSWTPEFAHQFWQSLDDKTLQVLQDAADNNINRLLEAIP
ncbi:hypothetical protein [Gracilinema caldarium]|uniref:Uncharacterized protein n=1 Tax=Gracilinema caldarium (strain ATCC 51460 / DSM 7334 / H1) TaxID=744872 RepID=F8F182_GRAC1|nr:hypothetical protein [Gracilinema caldarium]AEJ18726.1 hypothetical protein Spica_0566 [Gracilinema caldarium DSM 7334]